MPVADLHVHTTRSDGVLDPEAVPTAAAAAGLEAVAITDHDRLQPTLSAPVAERAGVEVIHGIELRVAAPELRVDLLGYGVEPTPELEAECDRLRTDRLERGAAIIDCVEDRLGIDLGMEPFDGIGRPHIARAIADHPAVPHDEAAAFDELIGNDGPCYRPRDVPTFDRGRRLLADAAAIVGLAHPLRYSDPGAALDLTADLDAVERWYDYGHPTDDGLVADAITKHDLLPTGGSDAHGETLGAAGLDRAAYRRVRSRLPAP